MESMPAADIAVTVGVDTHLDQHVAAVIDQSGRLCGTKAFASSTRGYVALVTWAESFGPVERIGIEGTGTYGAGLTRFAHAYGLQVVEVDRPDRSIRRRHGKSDPIDAQAAARATLAGVASTIHAGHRRGRYPPGDPCGRGHRPDRAAVWHPGVPGFDPRLGRLGHLG